MSAAPKIESTARLMGSPDDEAARRWLKLRQALGERSWPQDARTGPTMLDRDRVDEAARRALTLYPGPVGQLVHREIQAYLDFGHRFALASLTTRVIEDILGASTDPKQP